MTYWIAPHNLCGGLFLISDQPNRVVAVLDKNLNEGYDWDSGGFEEAWLKDEVWWRGLNMRGQFPPSSEAGAIFEFKNKLYVDLGAGELGFKKIRSVENIDVYVRPIPDAKAVPK